MPKKTTRVLRNMLLFLRGAGRLKVVDEFIFTNCHAPACCDTASTFALTSFFATYLLIECFVLSLS